MSTEQVDEFAEERRLAGVFMTDREIALVRGLEPEDLAAEVAEGTSDRARAILGGRLLLQAEVYQSIKVMALRYSSPAQQAAVKLLERIGAI